jgi:hypothetical protein
MFDGLGRRNARNCAIHRQKNICYRIIFTRFPNISLFRIVIDNFKNTNFIIH